MFWKKDKPVPDEALDQPFEAEPLDTLYPNKKEEAQPEEPIEQPAKFYADPSALNSLLIATAVMQHGTLQAEVLRYNKAETYKWIAAGVTVAGMIWWGAIYCQATWHVFFEPFPIEQTVLFNRMKVQHQAKREDYMDSEVATIGAPVSDINTVAEGIRTSCFLNNDEQKERGIAYHDKASKECEQWATEAVAFMTQNSYHPEYGTLKIQTPEQKALQLRVTEGPQESEAKETAQAEPPTN